jgi:hypothetical protein
MAIRHYAGYVFVALAAGALAGCAGPSPSALPAAAAPPAQARLYVAWDRNDLTGSEIRVYDAQPVAHPELLQTLKSPYPQIRGLTMAPSGNLYAAACTSCDDSAPPESAPRRASSRSNGIAVYPGGERERQLEYVAPPGELPIRVASAPTAPSTPATRFTRPTNRGESW